MTAADPLTYIYQYKMNILYKSVTLLYIADSVCRHNHNENKEKEIPGVNVNMNATEMCTDIPECTIAEEIRYGTQEHDHLSALTMCVING